MIDALVVSLELIRPPFFININLLQFVESHRITLINGHSPGLPVFFVNIKSTRSGLGAS